MELDDGRKHQFEDDGGRFHFWRSKNLRHCVFRCFFVDHCKLQYFLKKFDFFNVDFSWMTRPKPPAKSRTPPRENFSTERLCWAASRKMWVFKTSRKLDFLFQNLRGLSGDLRRLNGNPLKANFSMRIQLLGYSGKLDDVGFRKCLNLIFSCNMKIYPKMSLRREIFSHFSYKNRICSKEPYSICSA